MPLSAIFVGLTDFLVASSIFVAMLIVYRVNVGFAALLALMVLAIQIVLIFGISLFASALNVFYRDIRFVIPLGLQLWMYASRVIYPVSLVPDWLRLFYFLNPMASILDSYRRLLLFNQVPEWNALGLASAVSFLIMILAYRFFKQAERKFADPI